MHLIPDAAGACVLSAGCLGCLTEQPWAQMACAWTSSSLATTPLTSCTSTATRWLAQSVRPCTPPPERLLLHVVPWQTLAVLCASAFEALLSMPWRSAITLHLPACLL